ncbi:uncharacterized protein N7443_005890 [Penicillium atrosanguineum]|uniref:uncharacterized protein n=1 Tax=Penicillium atrosanguineum TaxID=1132637 RepID=UPI002399CF70|nr:uncharacterized protein N7443_005890 [Penicillium atrosanguineum]KAJ5300888.1 hypothetical protein N7443_005890 [Penicillium atrosanguineum]
MRHILLHPQLRAAIPRSAQRSLRNQLWTRFKSQAPRPSQRHEPGTPQSKDLAASARPAPPSTPAKTTVRKGPPERIMVYYGGTGRAVFLGMLRLTTIFLFGGACVIAAPACYADEEKKWLTPLVVLGGAVPMVVVAYIAAPYVNFIHLALPAFARKSRENAIHYAKDLPPTATLYLTTMRFNTIPRQTAVRLGDLLAEKDSTRPVTFRNLRPTPRPWWAGKTPTQYLTEGKSRPGKQSTAFYPQLWPAIFQKIQRNSPSKSYS